MNILKGLFLLITFIFAALNVLSQIPDDYPFATFINEENDLYISGHDANGDIITSKFSGLGNLLWAMPFQNPGFDKATDLHVDQQGNAFVSGYLFDNNSGHYRLCLIKQNGQFGHIDFVSTLEISNEGKGFGIAALDTNYYVCGYTCGETNRDFVIVKFSRLGNRLWTRTFNNPVWNKDDVATDILVDNNFIYAVGYTYNGPVYLNDIVYYSCDLDGNQIDAQIVDRKFTSETPASFVITVYYDSPFPRAKSRTCVSVISENPVFGSGKNFNTYYFRNNDTTNTMQIQWERLYGKGTHNISIPTAVASDVFGNVYVTGYTNMRNSSNYDFATMKLSRQDGSYGWTNPSVLSYDSLNGNDKSSSVKVRGSRLYVAGTSDSTQNGYYIAVYNQIQSVPSKEFEDSFVPSFARAGAVNRQMNKHSTVEVDSSGSMYLIAQSWNGSEAYYAVRKFSPQGEVLYTIDPFEGQFREEAEVNHSEAGQSVQDQTVKMLISGYPNPFNPATKISYTLRENSDVSLKIFDTSGKMIRELHKGVKQAGEHSADFDAAELPSGIYHAVLQAGNEIAAARLVLVK